MEDQLVMNRLPLPKYFDGQEWNTVIKPTRKCIPKYLHEDLPELKHIYIKQKFKQIGKFNCPKLDYFNGMIKNKKPHLPKSLSVNQKSKSRSKKKQYTYDQIKQQLQYALIIADKESNVVDQLLQKARKVKPNSQTAHKSLKTVRKKKSASQRTQTGKHFSNTVQLVFRNRKKEYLNSLKHPQELDTSEMEKKIGANKLLDFQ